jgi:hypothetical protein
LVSQKSKELIEDYIRRHKGKATKNDVVDYMASEQVPGKYRITRKTTLKTIDELGRDRIKIKKGERRGQSHYLSINDESEFYRIKQRLGELKNLLNGLPDTVAENLAIIKKTESKTLSPIKQDFLNLIHMAQLTIYGVITGLHTSIEKNIVSNEDRDYLFRSLRQVLTAADKQNKIMFPEVFRQATHIPKEMERLGVIKGTLYYNIFMSIINPLTQFVSIESKSNQTQSIKS